MTSDNKIKIFLLFLAVSIFSAIYFGVLPLLSEIKNNFGQIISQKNEIKNFQIKSQSVGAAEDYLSGIVDNIKKTQDIFIDREVPVDFIRFLEKTAKDCNISMEVSLSSPLKAKDEKWQRLLFQVNSSGSLPDFLKFFEKIENSPYLVDVQSLFINRLSEDDLKSEKYIGLPQGSVTSGISIKVYSK